MEPKEEGRMRRKRRGRNMHRSPEKRKLTRCPEKIENVGFGEEGSMGKEEEGERGGGGGLEETISSYRTPFPPTLTCY